MKELTAIKVADLFKAGNNQSYYAKHEVLQLQKQYDEAIVRINDMLEQDAGQAYKEAEKYIMLTYKPEVIAEIQTKAITDFVKKLDGFSFSINSRTAANVVHVEDIKALAGIKR